MTEPTWQQAIVPVDAATYKDDLLASLESAGSNITGWSDDSPNQAYVTGEANALAAGSDNIAALAKTASTDTIIQAGSTWVDATLSWFDITRFPATFAVWQISLIYNVGSTFTVDSSNASSIQAMANDGTIFNCTQQSAKVFNSGNSYINTVQFTARSAGTSGNVTTGFGRLISGPAGLQVRTGGSPTQTVVARNAESDTDAISRATGRWGVILGSPEGTAGWVRKSFDFLIPFYGDDGNTLNVTGWSVDDANPLGPGTVLVTIRNPTGPATAQEVAAVDAGLNGLDVKPVGSGALTVQAATLRSLTINITIQVDGSNASVGTNCKNAIENLGKAFPLGPATLVTDLITEVARGAALPTASIAIGSTTTTISPALPGFGSVVAITSNDFVGDLTLASGEVLVITANITVTP